jgi:hypothetical protein
LRAQETASLEFGAGLNIWYALSPRLSLGSGIEYTPNVMTNSAIHQIRYTRAGESVNARGNFENKYAVEVSNSFGDATTDLVVERSSDAQLAEQRFINIRLETELAMRVLRIPLSLQYHVPLGFGRVSCYGGISGQVLLENEMQIHAVETLNALDVQARAPRSVSLSGGRSFTLGYHAGILLDIPVAHRLSVQAGPSLNGYFEPVHRDEEIKVFPVVADFDLGIRYKF